MAEPEPAPRPDRPAPRLLGEAGALRLHHWPGSGEATLIVFGPRGGTPAGSEGWWGRPVAARLGWDTLFFASAAQDWYPAADMAALLPAALAAAGARRVACGASMGGYAALKYGRALGAQGAVALSPQASIDPADVPEDPRAAFAFDPRRHAGMAIGAEDLAAAAVFAFDPLDPLEAAHARRLARLPGLVATRLRHAGPATAEVLAEAGRLPAVLRALLDGDAPLAAARLRAARRDSPTLLRTLAVAAEAAGQAARAEALRAAARARGGRDLPRARVLDLRARALARLGRRQEEAAALRDWAALAPQAPEPRLRLFECLLALDAPEEAVAAFAEVAARGRPELRLHALHLEALKRLGRTEDAVAAARQAATAAPRLAAAQALLGETLLWARRRPAAREAFRRALGIDPGHDRARLGLLASAAPGEEGADPAPLVEDLAREGAAEPSWVALLDALRDTRRPAEAIAAGERAVALHPASVPLRHRLGVLRLAAGQAVAAEADFRIVVQAAPGLADGWLGLTDSLWRQKRFAEGREEAAAAAAAHPGHATLATRHASFLLAAGDLVGAERAARRALSLEAAEEAAWLCLADALWRQQRPKDAVRAMQEAAVALPGNGAILARLGHLLIGQDERAAAVEAFRRATEAGRAPAHVWLGLTEALWRQERLARAVEAARRGLAEHPNSAELRARLAQLMLAQGEDGAAREALAEALAAAPDSEDIHLAMADALWRQGRRAEAVAAAREAVAAAPGRPAVAARLGHLLIEAGEAEEAAAIFLRLTAETPDLATGWVGLSDAERLRKRIRPAIEACRRAELAGADRHTLRMLRFRLFGELEE
ncbi:tetratricopeptide repeat protein [Roseomonas sp. HF4]|uniref:tetratricopeptide repeat protein n=1 Tax=Roseomonas sp. HF4 TaxID=2562313 RepID=UPI0010C13AB1|nr:tetratricopeptide repeat protein [Roseomonas sp. HF4]